MYQRRASVRWVFIIMITVLVAGCAGLKKKRELLCRTWVHAHEQDDGKVKTYVPSTTELPPSRPRRKLVFNSDGSMQMITGGRSDRGESTSGKWSWLNKGAEIEVSLSIKNKEKLYVYKVIELDDKYLKLEKR